MSTNPIIEKIKKLLRLGRCQGATPAEAAAAMSKAMQLATEHGIDLAHVPTGDDGDSVMTHVTENSTMGVAQGYASGLVKRHFNVDTLFDSTRGKRKIHFIGLEENCHLAAYCYVYLVRAMNAAWRNRSNRRLRDREAFIRGYAIAINRAMPAVFHQPGLVVASQGYIERVLVPPGAKMIDPKKQREKFSDSALNEGFAAGRRDGIRNAIRGTDKPLIA